MTIRINHNIASLRGVRHLGETEQKLAESLERLSSGFRINRGADSPAGLMISEQMRSQIASVHQAVSNTEQAQAMVQTTEGSLNEVNNLLIGIRQLALHATNEGANDRQAREADQLEAKNILEAIGHIAREAAFGDRRLLDGTTGMSGVARGEGVRYVSATERTKSSPVEGYGVEIKQVASQAMLRGTDVLTDELVPGLIVTIMEGGESLVLKGRKDETAAQYLGRLQEGLKNNGLRVEADMSQDQRLVLRHKDYGSAYSFSAAASRDDILGPNAGVMIKARPGQDIQGTIGGEAAHGQGHTLTGQPGNDNTEGLEIMYTGPWVEHPAREDQPAQSGFRPQTGFVGYVHVVNNALAFQTGANAGEKVRMALPNAMPNQLGRNVMNAKVSSLADINLANGEQAEASLAVIDQSINEISKARGRLGAFQKNNLEVNLSALRIAAENLTAAESAIRDTDMAHEVAELVKNRLRMETASSALAHANHAARRVITLLD